MSMFMELFNSPWIQPLGWTLFHSLWQSLLCIFVVTAALRCLPSRLSAIRYTIASGGLLLIFLFSAGTFLYLCSVEIPGAALRGSTLNQAYSNLPSITENQSSEGLVSTVTSIIQANIPFIVLIWSIGTILFSLRVVSGWWYTNKLRMNATTVEGGWSDRIQQLAGELGINQIVTLAESTLIQAPVVIGYIKPIILIPVGMFSGLSTDQLESIFIHELIHIRRGDYVVNLIQSFLEALYFFNPFVWLISGIIRREREHCCDDAVVKVHGNALAYVNALAMLEEVRLSKAGLALSLAESKNQLLTRIKRIMEKSVKNYSSRERIAPVALLIIGLICASWLTIQSGHTEKDLGLQPNKETVDSDTTGKEKSARYYKKKVTTLGEDGVPKEETVESFEGDEELMVDLDLEIPPFPPIADIDIVIPSLSIDEVYDMNIDLGIAIPEVNAIPYLNLPFPAQFKMDTLPLPRHWEGSSWEDFGKEFEQHFKERFGDFYEKNEEELKNMMKEMELKFDQQFDQEFASKMENLAREHEQLARMHAEKFAQNHDALKLQEEHMKKFNQDIKRWEEENEVHLKKLEENLKVMEEKHKSLEKELRAELIKDGYLSPNEKIKSMRIDDSDLETFEINGKQIKPTDKKKYRELFEKHSLGPSRDEMRKEFSKELEGRKE